MKTVLKINLFLFFLIGIVTSCISGNGQSNSGNRIKEVRDVHDFSGISVSNGIELRLGIGSTEKVEIETNENLISKVTTEVHKGILKISINQSSWGLNNNHREIKAFVTAKQLESIHASSGSSIMGISEITGDHLSLEASSGSETTLQIKESETVVQSSSGSSMILKGKSDKIELSASSGSKIKADELNSETAIVEASSGSDIYLSVSKSLDAHASSGSSIHYSGKPGSVSKDKSSGASIDAE